MESGTELGLLRMSFFDEPLDKLFNALLDGLYGLVEVDGFRIVTAPHELVGLRIDDIEHERGFGGRDVPDIHAADAPTPTSPAAREAVPYQSSIILAPRPHVGGHQEARLALGVALVPLALKVGFNGLPDTLFPHAVGAELVARHTRLLFEVPSAELREIESSFVIRLRFGDRDGAAQAKDQERRQDCFCSRFHFHPPLCRYLLLYCFSSFPSMPVATGMPERLPRGRMPLSPLYECLALFYAGARIAIRPTVVPNISGDWRNFGRCWARILRAGC